MGHFDLYGNSYRTAQEAWNAEEAQCAAIDANIAMKRVQQLEQRINNPEQQITFLMEKCLELEQRIIELEKRNSTK